GRRPRNSRGPGTAGIEARAETGRNEAGNRSRPFHRRRSGGGIRGHAVAGAVSPWRAEGGGRASFRMKAFEFVDKIPSNMIYTCRAFSGWCEGAGATMKMLAVATAAALGLSGCAAGSLSRPRATSPTPAAVQTGQQPIGGIIGGG